MCSVGGRLHFYEGRAFSRPKCKDGDISVISSVKNEAKRKEAVTRSDWRSWIRRVSSWPGPAHARRDNLAELGLGFGGD